MGEYLFLEALGLGVAFTLGYVAGRGRKFKVKVPDYVPSEWKITEEGK